MLKLEFLHLLAIVAATSIILWVLPDLCAGIYRVVRNTQRHDADWLKVPWGLTAYSALVGFVCCLGVFLREIRAASLGNIVLMLLVIGAAGGFVGRYFGQGGAERLRIGLGIGIVGIGIVPLVWTLFLKVIFSNTVMLLESPYSRYPETLPIAHGFWYANFVGRALAGAWWAFAISAGKRIISAGKGRIFTVPDNWPRYLITGMTASSFILVLLFQNGIVYGWMVLAFLACFFGGLGFSFILWRSEREGAVLFFINLGILVWVVAKILYFIRLVMAGPL